MCKAAWLTFHFHWHFYSIKFDGYSINLHTDRKFLFKICVAFEKAAQDLLAYIWYANLSLKREFPYFKNFMVLGKLPMEHHTQPWDVQCPSVHLFGKQRSQQGWCREFSVTAAHWKSAQTEAVSLHSPGRHFSVYAVAQDTVHLLAKWSQESYWQQVKLELYGYSNTLQNDSWKSLSKVF